MNCPNCSDKTLQATATPAKVSIQICPNCRGSWFAAGDLPRLLGNPTDFERQLERAKVNAKLSDKPSPISGDPMLEIPYRGKHPIYICQTSQGIWVEKEELRAVIS